MLPGCRLRATVLLAVPLLLGGRGALYAQMMLPTPSIPPMHQNDPNHVRMHPINTECSGCHIAGRDARTGNAATLLNSQENLCARCHSNSMQKSHPSGFIPKDRKAISVRYPLDWKGYLTCSTCHEVHSDFPGRLRDNVRGRDMCLSCHSQGFFDSRRDDAAHRIAP